MSQAAAEERFEQLFTSHYGDVLAYAVRRCPSHHDAEDIVAETFAVAWRRIFEIPEGQRARLWLFGTAHLVRLNHRRTHRRRESLAQRVRQRWQPASGRAAEADVIERDRLDRAFAALTALDREVLQLHAWERLDAGEIADALDISLAAVWKRLQRARDRLAAALDDLDDRSADALPLAHITRKAE